MKKAIDLFRFLLGVPLTIAAFAFIGKVLFDSRDRITPVLSSLEIFPLIIGFFLLVIFFFLKGIVWMELLKLQNTKGGYSKGIYIYSFAETKRYIPGNIFGFVSRVRGFNREHIKSKTVIKGIAIEAIILTSSALLISLPGLWNFKIASYSVAQPLLLLFSIGILFAIIFMKKKKIGLRKVLSYRGVFLISSISWIIFGIANFFISISIGEFDPSLFVVLSSLFVASWLIGYLSVITPMGLGVREVAIVGALSPIVPLFIATSIALFSRIIFILSEITFVLLSYIYYKFKFKLPISWGILTITSLVISYISYFIYFTIKRHDNFFSGKFDLGNMDQVVWNTINGNIFNFTNPDSIEEISRLAFHADFILILLSPFYLIWQDPKMLLIIQTVVIGLGGYFVYLLSKEIIKKEKISILLSASYLLNFYVQEQNVFDFHAVSLSTTFLLATFYFMIKKRYLWFVLLLFLAFITKENVYLVGIAFGLLLYRQGKRFWGFTLSIFSIAAFYLLVSKFMPGARGPEYFALSYLSFLGDTPFEIISSLFLKPQLLIGQIFSTESFEYLYRVFFPLGFISLLSPFYLLFIVPELLINLLSTNSNLRSIQFHYGAVIIPFMYISAMYGIKRINVSKRLSKLKPFVFYYILLVMVFSTWEYSLLPGLQNQDLGAFKNVPNREFIKNSLEIIPEGASVASTNNLGAHLSQRKEIFVLPNGIEGADYLVFLNDDLGLTRSIEQDPHFRLVVNKGEFFIFQRRQLASF